MFVDYYGNYLPLLLRLAQSIQTCDPGIQLATEYDPHRQTDGARHVFDFESVERGVVCYAVGAPKNTSICPVPRRANTNLPFRMDSQCFPSGWFLTLTMIGFLLSGFTYWSHDVGGFVEAPSRELYRRWLGFGVLTSHTRTHGAPPREPWAYGESFTDIFAGRSVSSMRSCRTSTRRRSIPPHTGIR